MTGNRAVAYLGPKKLEIQNLDYPKLVDSRGNRSRAGDWSLTRSTRVVG